MDAEAGIQVVAKSASARHSTISVSLGLPAIDFYVANGVLIDQAYPAWRLLGTFPVLRLGCESQEGYEPARRLNDAYIFESRPCCPRIWPVIIRVNAGRHHDVVR